MKVDNKVSGPPLHSVDQPKSNKLSTKSTIDKTDLLTNSGAPKGSSKVDVSERAQMMSKAKEIAGRPDTVDEAKVARLQKMIDEGTYKTDSQSIADRLVDEHMSFPTE